MSILKVTPAIMALFLLFILSHSLTAQDAVPDEWKTHFEQSGFLSTPNYIKTLSYITKISEKSKYAELISFGETPQGRELVCLLVSKKQAFTPDEAKKTGLPVVMLVNGIHPGEICGKDASLLLLREILITKEKEYLLDSLTLLVVPVFNVDGHERRSPYNRINQIGPEETGWRVTAQNLNLNRDWLKADAPEMQQLLKLFSDWMPDVFVDSHSTDGADFQYSVLYKLPIFQDLYPPMESFTRDKLAPYLEETTTNDGFLIAPYLGFREHNLEKGLSEWVPSPRFSHGYAAVRNRIGLLIEAHVLKPYKERVYATKSVVTNLLQFVYNNKQEILDLNYAADTIEPKQLVQKERYFPAAFEPADYEIPFYFKGFKWKKEYSEISGSERLIFTDEPMEMTVPYKPYMNVTDSIAAPYAYAIPPEYSYLAERLALHGVEYHVLAKPLTTVVTKYKFTNAELSAYSYESRQTVSNVVYDELSEELSLPAGTVIIKVEQPAAKIILSAFEPKLADSFLRWGFLN
jgi:hypothetical protein